MKKLLPLILAIIGLAAGSGAGMFLKPAAENAQPETDTPEGASPDGTHVDPDGAMVPEDQTITTATPIRRSEDPNADNEAGFEYVKLNNQFVVPVVSGSKVIALVVMSLTIEVATGHKEAVYSIEPKLRDSFLQVLFNHANSGGFEGAFTQGEKMNDLRGSLFEAAVQVLGDIATDVLIIDIVRQDV